MGSFQNFTLSESLENNISIIESIFHKDDTLILRRFHNQHNPDLKFCIFFINGMIDDAIINNDIIKPIIYTSGTNNIDSIDIIQNQIILSNEISKSQDISVIIQAIISGNTVLFMDGVIDSLTIASKGWPSRQITEPEVEKVIRGPREGFNESIITNLSLLRRKLKTNDLKFEYKTIGSTSATQACISYIEGVADQGILAEIHKRIDNIKIDGVLDIKNIQELIDDAPFSIFQTSDSTEKPDIVAAKLLEGRIAIFLDGTPSVMTVPFIFVENFQSGEDHYSNYYFASIRRIIRMLAFIITISIPAIYLSLVTYHKEVLPTPLLLTIFAARKGIPFPSIVALIGILIVFEILIEAGARMPTIVGQTLSVVGALVLGTSAVEANLISSPMIIVVAITSITGLILPNLLGTVIILRTLFILFSGVFGLFGYIFGMSGLLIHLYKLKSFNMPYMATMTSINPLDLKDTYIRAPLWYTEWKKYGGPK